VTAPPARVTWTPAYVGLGSNLEDPPAQLRAACAALAALRGARLVAVSAFLRNPPLGPADQPEFVNAVAGLLTTLAPRELLAQLKAIERAHGRAPDGRRWGPRVLDLDLLVHGRARVEEAGLTVPHPGIAQRNFVLFPLLEIAPGLEVPGLGEVATLASHLDGSTLRPVD